MQSNRNLLWVVLVGTVLVVAAYYLGASQNPAPVTTPAATAPAEKPAAAAPAEETTVDSADPPPGDLTAADAAETVKRIEEEQRQQMQMMEKSRLPGDGEWVDGPGEEPPQKN